MSRVRTRFPTHESRFPYRMLEQGKSAASAVVPETIRERPALFAALAILVGLGGVLYYLFGPELHRHLRMRRM